MADDDDNPLKRFSVTVKMEREYSATIEIEAHDQAEADRLALLQFNVWASEEGVQIMPLGFPEPWDEHENTDRQPEIERGFRCVDCGKHTDASGEYYSVHDDVWAASGLAMDGGMLCLACLSRRIGRRLTSADFVDAGCTPSDEAWRRYSEMGASPVQARACPERRPGGRL